MLPNSCHRVWQMHPILLQQKWDSVTETPSVAIMYNLIKNHLLVLFSFYHMEVPCGFIATDLFLNYWTSTVKRTSLPNILIFDSKCLHLVIKKDHNKEEPEYHRRAPPPPAKQYVRFQSTTHNCLSQRHRVWAHIILQDSKGKRTSCS